MAGRRALQLATDQLDLDHERSFELASESEALFKQDGDALGAAGAFRVLISAILARGDGTTARKMITERLGSARAAGDKGLEAALLLCSSDMELHNESGDEALLAAEASRDLFRCLADAGRESLARSNESSAYLLLNKIAEAAAAAEASRGLAEASGDSFVKGKAWQALAVAFERSGNCVDALNAAKNAREIFRIDGDRSSEGLMLCTVSRLHAMDGQQVKALEAAQEAVDMLHAAEQFKKEVLALREEASVKMSAGEVDEVVMRLQQKLRDFGEAGQKTAVGALLGLMTDVHLSMENFPAAMQTSRASCEAFKEVGDWRLEATALLALSSVNFVQQRYTDALEPAQRSLELYRKHGLRAGESAASDTLALIFTEIGEPEKSPYREKVMDFIKAMVSAVERVDAEAYMQAVENLTKFGGISDKDLADALAPVISKGGDDVRDFLANIGKEHGGLPDIATHHPAIGSYAAFRSGGLQYGPVFRAREVSWRRGEPGKVGSEVLSVLQLHDNAESWEESMQMIHPGLFDSAIQSPLVLFA